MYPRRVSIGSDSRRATTWIFTKPSVAKVRDSSVDVDSSVDHGADASVDIENDYVDYHTITMDAMYRTLPILDPSEIPGYKGLPAETKAFACAMFHVRVHQQFALLHLTCFFNCARSLMVFLL